MIYIVQQKRCEREISVAKITRINRLSIRMELGVATK